MLNRLIIKKITSGDGVRQCGRRFLKMCYIQVPWLHEECHHYVQLKKKKIKLPNIKYKENFENSKKTTIMLKGTSKSVNFFSRRLIGLERVEFTMLWETKECQLRILHLAKLSFKNKKELSIMSGKKNPQRSLSPLCLPYWKCWGRFSSWNERAFSKMKILKDIKFANMNKNIVKLEYFIT